MLDAIKDVVRKSSIHVCIVNCGGWEFYGNNIDDEEDTEAENKSQDLPVLREVRRQITAF